MLLWFKVTALPSQAILLHLSNFMTVDVSNPTSNDVRVIVKNPSSGAEVIRIDNAPSKLNQFVALTIASRSTDSYVALDDEIQAQSSHLGLPTLALISESVYLLGNAVGQASSIQGF